MTSFLRLNGITVPLALGSAGLSQRDIGSEHDAADGSPIFNRRATKRKWSGRTVVQSAREALALRDLVTGKGNVLNFDTQSFYSTKGLAPTSVAGGWSFTTSSPKFGAAMAQWTTGNAVWPFFSSASGSPWTLAWWLNENAGGWHHYLQTANGDKWIDGVSSPGGSMLGLVSVTSGVVTLGSTTTSKLDDVVALPCVVPSTWPAQMYAWGAAGNPFSALPKLTADGLFVEQNAQVSVKGKAGELKAVVAADAGALTHNLQDFAFELVEA